MAVVFDIERFSTADGPGIRTSVFMKGCNLHCPWCHNPEGISFKKQLSFDRDKCIGCGDCSAVCPSHAHSIREGIHFINRGACISCMKCASACHSGALEVIGMDYSLDSLTQILLEDKTFYVHSGGGITVTGGEPSCQSEFVTDLFRRMHENGISTAIETNLSRPWKVLAPLIDEADLVMFDIKSSDTDMHDSVVGGSLQQVMDNIRNLKGKPLIPRTPVIPGFNDSEVIIGKIASFLQSTVREDILYYELLTYHEMGASKHTKLGSVSSFHRNALSRDTMLKLARHAAKQGPVIHVDGKTVEI